IELNCADQHCELHMLNSYVSNNSFYQTKGGGGIRAENATLDIQYSSILGNNNEVGMDPMNPVGDSIDCVGDQVAGVIRNSAIARQPMGNLLSINCDPAKLMISGTLLDSDVFAPGNHKTDSETILGLFLTNLITGARPVDKKVFTDMNPDNQTPLSEV